MNKEIAELRGRLSVSEKLIDTITIGIDIDIGELRSLADRYEPKETLQTERITIVARRLDEDVRRLRELRDTVARLKKDLGEI